MAFDSGILERPAPAHPVVHRAPRVWRPRPLELWRSREILYLMVTRAIKARYAQTFLGALWTVFQPLAMLGILSYSFSRFQHKAIGVPYALWAIAGIVLWGFVSRAITSGATSLRGNLALLSRTAVPRALMPVAAVISAGVDLVVGIVIYLVIGLAYGVHPTWRFLAVPVVILFAALLATGLSLLLCPFEARYRDVGQTLPFVVQLWFFISPVGFQFAASHGGWSGLLYDFNPMVGLLESFRWTLLGTSVEASHLVVSLVFSSTVLLLGYLWFTRAEHDLVDEL